MTDLDNRLENIEKQLQLISRKQVTVFDDSLLSQYDGVTLGELWGAIWGGKFLIIAITAFFSISALFYALSLPNMYKSTLVLAPAQAEGKGGMGALAAQYGGLAAMAGINLGGGDSARIKQAIELIKSWPFLESFISKYNLKSQIMAVQGWDRKTAKLIYDYDTYNPVTNAWMLGEGAGEPSSWSTYRVLSSMLSVSNDATTGMLNLSVEHYSPEVAYKWVNLLLLEINSFYQQQDIRDAQKNIDYLNAKIAETNISEMKSVFYSMIESQTKTLMLAEVSDQYLVKSVVPAKVAEQRSKPNRVLICVLGVMFGGLVGFILVLLLYFSKNHIRVENKRQRLG